MATYNGEKYIREQIDSILCQLDTDDEIIVSDDGFTDKTLDIISAYNDARIKIFHNKNRKGVVGNFENALNQVQGDYIFLSDQDDVWLPDKVEKCQNALQTADLVVTDCAIIKDRDTIIKPSFFEIFNSGSGFAKNFTKNTYLGCCMAFQRKILSYILPFPPKIAMHDIWIGLSVELNGNPFFLNSQLVLYRRHENNASSTSANSELSVWYRILYRLQLLYYLFVRKVHHRKRK
jgi:glycosyltransferase involved in cell wall biosynthesis